MGRICFAVAGGLLFAACPCRAESALDGPNALEGAPRPATLPELTHPRTEGHVEWAMGAIGGRSVANAHVPLHVFKVSVEAPLYDRRIYGGVDGMSALGGPLEDTRIRLVTGNVEAFVRGVWATKPGLSSGGGLGVLVPANGYDREGSAFRVAQGAGALEPWATAYFLPGHVTMRPFIDLRDIAGAFVLQFRQTIDWAIDARGQSRNRLYAWSYLFAGYKLKSWVTLGLEAHQVYVVDGPTVGRDRAFIALSPVVRGVFGSIEPWLGIVANVNQPYLAGGDRAVAARFGLTFLY